MSRPGFVLEVDDRTPPLVVHEGLGFRLENFPLGTRVIYPPESLPAMPRRRGARSARRCSTRSTPTRCRAAAAPGMRLTIAFDDVSLPLPPMRAPDIRQRIIEQVLTMAADAGVDDVELVAANALHRRMTPAELQAHRRRAGVPLVLPPGRALQPRRRGPRQPRPHGAHRPGRGRRDQPAGRRVRPAGLRQRQPGGDGRRAQVGADRAGVVQEPAAPPQRPDDGALALLHGPHEVRTCTTPRGGWARLLKEHLKIFQIETTLDNNVFPDALRLPAEARVGVVGARPGLDARPCAAGSAVAPQRLRHKLFHDLRSPYGLTGIDAGETEAVHERTIAAVHRQQLVEVQGQSDVLVMGVPYLGPLQRQLVDEPDPGDLHGARLLLQLLPRAAGGTPRRRGDPLPPARTRASTSCTTRATSTSTRRSWPSRPTRRSSGRSTSSSSPTDPWYIHLYRTSHAYHGVHPFYMWYWAAHAMDHVDDVIWVGADRKVAARLGFRAASHAGRRAGDGVRHGRAPARRSPTCTTRRTYRGRAVTARGLAPRRRRATSARSPAGGAGAGARWCRARPSPSCRRAERRSSPPTGRAGDRRWSAREVAQKGGLEPLFRSQVRTQVEGLDVLARIEGPVIFVANHASPPRHPADPAVAARRVAAAYGGGGGGRLLLRHLVARGRVRAACSTRSRSTAAAARCRPRRARCSPTAGASWSSPRAPARRTAGSGSFRLGAAYLAARARRARSCRSRTAGRSPRCRAGQNWPSPGRRQLTVRFGEPLDPARGRVGARLRAADHATPSPRCSTRTRAPGGRPRRRAAGGRRPTRPGPTSPRGAGSGSRRPPSPHPGPGDLGGSGPTRITA